MRICIVGSYGYTGTLICKELASYAIPFSIVGRNEARLEEQKDEFPDVRRMLVGDILNQEFSKKIANYFDLVINCAGPFTEESNVLLKEAAYNGINYLDITGEVDFVKNSFNLYNTKAIETGALIIHSCAYESLLVDLVVQHQIANQVFPKRIRTFYSFNQNRISPGTKITMKLSKYRQPLKVLNGNWVQSDIQNDQLKIRYQSEEMSAVPYPLPEIAYYQPQLTGLTAESYLLVKPSEAIFIFADIKPSNEINSTLEKLKQIKQQGPTEKERKEQTGTIIVNFLTETNEKTNVLETKDMYGTTAKAILEAVLQLQQTTNLRGVVTPAKLFVNKETEILNRLEVSLITESNFAIVDA